MRISDLVSKLEAQFPCADGLPMYVAQTGEPYVEFFLTARGSIPMSEAVVVAALHQAIAEYAADKRGTLYWRIRPETATFAASSHGQGRVQAYARLLISDKPALYPDTAAYVTARDAA